MDSQVPHQSKKKLKPPENAIKHVGLGFQMMLTIGVFGWLGYKLDTYLSSTPAFITSFIIIALVGNIYLILKSTK